MTDEQERERIRQELDRLDRQYRPICMHQLTNGTICCHPATDRYALRCKAHFNEAEVTERMKALNCYEEFEKNRNEFLCK